MLDQQDKPYDNGAKRLLTLCAQDFLDWFVDGATFTGKLSERFQSISIEADAIHEVFWHDELALFQIEIQSKTDAEMVQRLLQYSMLTYCRYKRPVNSYVIYLRDGGSTLQSPLVLTAPNGKELMRFHFEVIVLRHKSYQELLASPLRGIWPFVPFTRGGMQREVLEEVMKRFTPAYDSTTRELLALTCLFASLMSENKEDKIWIERKAAMLNDFLQEAPLYQHILQQGREIGEERGKIEGKAEGKAEGKEEERKARVLSLRQKVLMLVQKRFPQQNHMTGKLVNLIEKPDKLEDVLVQLALVQSGEDVQNCLLEAIQKDE